MADFSHEFSSFPSRKITRHNFQNVNNEITSTINDINTSRAQGLYNQAARTIQNNSDKLEQCIADAITFRTWEEEIYNTQIYAKQMQQSVHFDEKEPDCIEGDVWLGGDN